MEPAPCRDTRLWHQTGLMPARGGADAQPLERMTQMLFAERVRRLFEKQRASDNWAQDMTEADRALVGLLYSEADNG